MGNKLYEESSVQAIANAIRTKLGTDAVYKIGDMATAVSLIPTGITPTGSITLSSNGTYDVGQFGTAVVNVPQYGKPVVSQTGTWQYKSTYPCGFLIIGKDDDVSDSAMFVRMVNGYGFPVTLNSSQQWQNNPINSDADTEYSTYPEGSKSNFPNGGTINQLNKFVIKENRGEIALHGDGNEKIWNSDFLTGTILDTYYEAYTTGGGTKTEEEFKTAFMQKYADNDVIQGAPVLARKRELMQAAIDNWLYTIGTWGGSFDVIIDDINCGTSGAVNWTTQPISRSQNWMGDGQLTNTIALDGANPYKIYRNSGGLFATTVEENILLAYNNRVCIDVFHHYYLDGTAEKWNNLKQTLDIVKSYYEQGKIFVVTRKQYYELGEFVEHPIVSLFLETKSFAYGIGHTFTENDFNMGANLDNNTMVSCENDKILYLDGIDTTTEGIYTAKLEYRGHFVQCSVTILNDIPSEFLLENYSYTSDEPFSRYMDIGPISPDLQYPAGKSYRIQFHLKVETEVAYGNHYLLFSPPRKTNRHTEWRTSILGDYTFNTVNGVSEGDVVVEFTVLESAPVNSLVYCPNGLNTTVTGSWTITNGYIYEIPTPEAEGGE